MMFGLKIKSNNEYIIKNIRNVIPAAQVRAEINVAGEECNRAVLTLLYALCINDIIYTHACFTKQSARTATRTFFIYHKRQHEAIQQQRVLQRQGSEEKHCTRTKPQHQQQPHPTIRHHPYIYG